MNISSTNSFFDVAIIGGGFTGSTLAVRLLRDSAPDLSVVLIDRGHAVARGVAYGTQFGWHLLNVPAANMSALPEDPDHFLRWAQENHDSGVEPESFVARRVYGQYLESLLRDATSKNHHRFEVRHDHVIALEGTAEAGQIHLRSGETIEARKVVLALGNFPPADPALPQRQEGSPRYHSLAWLHSAVSNVDEEREILLLGTGLTAVDTALALRARGFVGVIHLLSRRGLLPRQHKSARTWPPFWDENSPRTTRGLLRLIRNQVNRALEQGIEWRAVFDSLRPFTSQIWQSLPPEEKRRFLRHARPYWEIHRHRVAPDIAGIIAHQLVNQQLQVHAGRVLSYNEDADGVTVTYRDRRTQAQRGLVVDRIINCTGPETDCRKMDDPLLISLRAQGLIRPDPLFIGLDADDSGALINSAGMPSHFLYTLGPARKGQLWETTAVPEIREQVAELAKLLNDELAPPRTGTLKFGDLPQEVQL